MADTAEIATNYLVYFILPLWIIVGVFDWMCHRAARIEFSAGPMESVIHLAMLAEAGVAVLLGLFFEINSLVLLIMLVAWAAHEATGYWDLAYASAHRKIAPVEQRVHDYLGVVPLLALSFVIVIHWADFIAILGLGGATADWHLRFRMPPVNPIYLWGLMAIIAVNILLFLEELYRGVRAMRAAHRQAERRAHSLGS